MLLFRERQMPPVMSSCAAALRMRAVANLKGMHTDAFCPHCNELGMLVWESALLAQLLDVEKEEAVVAEGVGSFDVIFATNVLHATRNMSNTLLNCKVKGLSLTSGDRSRRQHCNSVPLHIPSIHGPASWWR